MITIGVTGSFGTGKSAVAEFFKELGAGVVDADEISHRILEQRSKPYRDVVSNFGKGILDDNGDIDRSKIGEIVFKSKKYLSLLCRIIHPVVARSIERTIRQEEKRRRYKALVIDAPLLYEANVAGLCDVIVVVECDLDTQLERCGARTGLATSQIQRRISMQMPLSIKKGLADHVIDNSGSLEKTRRETEKVWKRILKKQKSKKRPPKKGSL